MQIIIKSEKKIDLIFQYQKQKNEMISQTLILAF